MHFFSNFLPPRGGGGVKQKNIHPCEGTKGNLLLLGSVKNNYGVNDQMINVPTRVRRT